MRPGPAPGSVYVVKNKKPGISKTGLKRRRIRKVEKNFVQLEIFFGNKQEAYFEKEILETQRYHWSLLSITEKEFYLNYKPEKQKEQTVGSPGNMEKIPNKILNFKKQIKWKHF